MSDYLDVGCEACREALSARLDGEAPPAGWAAADAHLAGCSACRGWHDRAAAVTRLARTGAVNEPVDVTSAVLAAAPGRGRARLAVALRLALGLVALAQLAVAARHMAAAGSAGGHVHGGAVLAGTSAGHLWHESAAWAIAVAAGLLWIALRPRRLAGALPILSVFVGVLVLLNVLDAIGGRLDLSHLATHAFVLAGYAIVVALSRPSMTMSPRSPVPATARPADAGPANADPTYPDPANPDPASSGPDWAGPDQAWEPPPGRSGRPGPEQHRRAAA